MLPELCGCTRRNLTYKVPPHTDAEPEPTCWICLGKIHEYDGLRLCNLALTHLKCGSTSWLSPIVAELSFCSQAKGKALLPAGSAQTRRSRGTTMLQQDRQAKTRSMLVAHLPPLPPPKPGKTPQGLEKQAVSPAQYRPAIISCCVFFSWHGTSDMSSDPNKPSSCRRNNR